MIDYICITKHLDDKDILNTKHLQLKSINYLYGFCWYYIKMRVPHCEPMEIGYRDRDRCLVIKGSLPYFYQGHNFTDNPDFAKLSIDYICDALDTDLWSADVHEFENGIIMPIDVPPIELLKAHSPGSKQTLKELYNGKCRMFSTSKYDIKLYDPIPNLKTKIKPKSKLEMMLGKTHWEPEQQYIKFEIRYKGGKNYKSLGYDVDCLFKNDDMQNYLKEDIWNKYQSLNVMKQLLPPDDKNILSTPGIILHAFARHWLLEDKPIEELRKLLYDELKLYGNGELFSNDDKKIRRRKLAKHLNNLHIAEQSQYDLSDKIAEA